MGAIVNAFISVFVLWVFFLAVMQLRTARDAGKLRGPVKPFAYAVLYIGWTLDAFVNIFVMTFVFFEIPGEFTVTARVKRHKRSVGNRGKIASWLCDNFLDPFDPSGSHCE